MINFLYSLIDVVLPFEWLSFNFMKNAFLALLLSAPLFGALGSMVVSKRMAFFSDALGHGAFTGIAIGLVSGLLTDVVLAAVFFAVIFGVAITLLKKRSRSSSDTVIGVFSSTAAALGIAILSLHGGVARYSHVLTGDILSISPGQIGYLFITFLIVGIIWLTLFNKAFLIIIDKGLAYSKATANTAVELVFTVILAVLVAISINWIGLLLINSFLILPAATAKLLSRNLRQFHSLAIIIALFCALNGLWLSYYLGIATGAAIVLLCAGCYFLALLLKSLLVKFL